MIRFYSTNKKSPGAGFSEAVIRGIAPDGGLFMPETVERLPQRFFSSLDRLSFPEMAFQIAEAFLRGAINSQDLKTIVYDAIDFDAPLAEVGERVWALELFHGPTLAFKDFGARFLARTLAYITKDADREITVLVATSGDTGSAVAQGFYRVPGIRVCLLYPSGKVSYIQEQQLTTLGENITAVEVEGTFDDCQRMVKEAFADPRLGGEIQLTSANSINIARLLPQMFYYFYAYAQLEDKSRPLVFSVPSGNFGNLTAGLLAWKMGLPAARFVAATNRNDV
ncbi:MAG TPA: threonine synthase, partial [Anseongella sp.]|nr:threonine synthase [Anseongella sp.]